MIKARTRSASACNWLFCCCCQRNTSLTATLSLLLEELFVKHWIDSRLLSGHGLIVLNLGHETELGTGASAFLSSNTSKTLVLFIFLRPPELARHVLLHAMNFFLVTTCRRKMNSSSTVGSSPSLDFHSRTNGVTKLTLHV